MRHLSFKPIFKERVWGGRWIEEQLGRALPSERSFGESWEIVDRAEVQSVMVAGSYTGKPLRLAIAEHSIAIMGPGWNPEDRFPILVKWLDCRERLSLQVHPPAAVAAELGGEPKTECWYIADATPGAALMVGLKAGVTREQFQQGLQDDQLEACCHRIPVTPGESIFVSSGRIHAIDAGNLILEIQQNSDTTYRVYDWGRLGLDGNPRDLHIEASLKCIDFEDFEPSTLKPAPGEQVIAACAEFRVRKLDLHVGETSLAFGAEEEPRILSVVEGKIREQNDGNCISRGDNVVLPFAESFNFVAEEEATVIVTDQFAR